MSREDAERTTRDRFGDVRGVHDEVERLTVKRYARQLRVQWIDALLQDLRLAARSLRAKPGYATALTLTLALGIGANLAIFTVVNGVLLRPLPLPEPQRLVRVFNDIEGRRSERRRNVGSGARRPEHAGRQSSMKSAASSARVPRSKVAIASSASSCSARAPTISICCGPMRSLAACTPRPKRSRDSSAPS